MLDDFEVKKAVKEFAGLYCIHGLRQIPRFSDNDKRRGETYESASHSFRVTALTNARERGSDVIDLQDFAGPQDYIDVHSKPRSLEQVPRLCNQVLMAPAELDGDKDLDPLGPLISLRHPSL
jgi:hypothetical protein